MNRIEVRDATLYELAVNLGQIGPRATLIARAVAAARARSSHPVVIDLGERDGDLGLERADRARVDYSVLSSLGYRLVVPYEFELALGANGLADLHKEFPNIEFLAANVTEKTTEEGGKLFIERHVVEVDGLKIGFFGIVDPDLRDLLAKSVLADFTFEDPVDAAARETATLRADGVDAVVMLSNLHPRDNALVSREVMGLDAIVADLHVRWAPEEVRTEVTLPGRPRSRPGSPALVPRSFANGLGVGSLDLVFRSRPEGGFFLSSLSHDLESVTDRTPADAALVGRVRTMVSGVERPRGEVLLPAFQDILAQRPHLRDFDSETAQGRISKRMWEEFLARLVRYRASAEVTIIRKLPHFPPAIGELHEAEIRSWLWTEDAIVVVDLSGADLRAILAEDIRDDLRLSGCDKQTNTIHGRRIQDRTYYRVATTDLLLKGLRFTAFERACRIKRSFEIGAEGRLRASGSGAPVSLRRFVLDELKRLRTGSTDEAYLRRLANMFERDPPFEPLVTFRFDRPTVFGSFNRVTENRAFGTVNESRATSTNSSVIGTTMRFLLGVDLEKLGIDLGVLAAFSRRKLTIPRTGKMLAVEPADDLQFDLGIRRKFQGSEYWQPQPFVRTVFDTEFTPTFNPFTRETNPHQILMRGESGVLFTPGRGWNRLELGAMLEQDIVLGGLEAGVRLRAQYEKTSVRCED